MSVESMTPEIERVLQAAYPGEDARYFAPMAIGSDPTTADVGAAAVLDGVKTTTSSAYSGLAGRPASLCWLSMHSVGRAASHVRDHRDRTGRNYPVRIGGRRPSAVLRRG